MIGGWDTLAAKITSFVIGVGLVAPLVLVRDKLYVYECIIIFYGHLADSHAFSVPCQCLKDNNTNNHLRSYIDRVLVCGPRVSRVMVILKPPYSL